MNIDELQIFFPQAVAIAEGNISETIEIRCPSCLEFNYWQVWLANWIDLLESEFGKNATHIRMDCPNCHTLYDHKNVQESNWVVRNLG